MHAYIGGIYINHVLFPEAGALVNTINISNSRQETFNIQASDHSIVIGNVTGNVTVDGKAIDPFQVSASGSVGNFGGGSDKSIGGAIVYSNVATVDLLGDLC